MSASDDVIATLSSRVSELSKRVVVLEAELESAQKRIAIYEEHDQTIQDALSGALKAAYTIRERAETTAAQILEQAREERRVLLKEIERLRDERDQLQNEIADQRRSGIAAVSPRPLTSDTAAQELRAVASEALRGLFQEIVDDMRSAPRATAPEPPPPAPQAQAPASAPERTPEARPASMETPAPPPPPAPAERSAEAPPTYEFMKQVQRPSVTEEGPAAVPAAPEAKTETAEDVDVTPAASAPEEEPQGQVPVAASDNERASAPPLEVVASREVEEIAPPRVDIGSPGTDIQLVLSPVPSFPRLVEIERHIQSLPAVRTLYVRDFRAGVATLAVSLRAAMTAEEFAATLIGLSELRLRVVSSARNSLELRIDGAASIA